MHTRVDTRPEAHSSLHRLLARTVSMVAAPLLAGAFIAFVGLLGSCSSTQAREDDGVSSSQFKDVVVPAGLRLIDDAHESHSIEAASWRHGHFVYSGSVPGDDAASYVRQRMPQHNWELVADEKVDENTTRLRFLRGHYAAEYRFIRQDGRTQMVVDYQTDYSRR